MANRTYINDSHQKYSEACQKEVEEMSKLPLSGGQFWEQCRRNREQASIYVTQESRKLYKEG